MPRPSMHTVLSQDGYVAGRRQISDWVAKSFKKSLSTGELTKLETFKKGLSVPRGRATESDVDAFFGSVRDRNAFARKLMTRMVMEKAGVTSSLGYNFYDLRAPVQLSFPVNVPFRNSLARIGRVNDGVGVAANWKATRNAGYLYGGASEGNRVATATPDENNYTANYKELGIERAATFTSQFAGEGYADNVADEHLRGLYELWLQEESLMLLGNDGTASGNNGFALGTAATPTGVASAIAAATSLPSGTHVSAAVVYLTAMGNPANIQYGYVQTPTVASGLTPSYTRNNADGSKDIISGGMSAVSAMSAVLTTSGPSPSVVFSVPAGTKGVFGYAWYVNITDASAPSKANAFLAAITQFPTFTVSAAPAGTQNALASGAPGGNGLSADNSFNTLDFPGLLTYVASTAGATWTDLGGGSLTSQKNGRVTEVETILETIFQQYQAGVDDIWGSADAVANLDQAVRYQGANNSGYQFVYQRDSQNNVLGGFVVSGYQSRYQVNNPTGANVIPIRIHPMMPAGTLFFDCSTIPYPQSRAPFSRGMLVQRDYYSIEWPLVARNWTFGTYVHETLAHNFPWIPAVLTGIGPFVGS